MKTKRIMKTFLITLPVMGIICTAGIATAGTGVNPLSPTTQPQEMMALSAKDLTTVSCLICHGDPQAGQQRLAPPFMMVKRHYQSLSKREFVKTVTSWVTKPSVEKSRMPGAINHFGLMPTFGLPEAQVKVIAEYVYNTDFPMSGHGGMGMGRGMARGHAAAGGKGRSTDEGKCEDGACDSGKVAALKVRGSGQGACGNCDSSKELEIRGNKSRGAGHGREVGRKNQSHRRGHGDMGKGRGHRTEGDKGCSADQGLCVGNACDSGKIAGPKVRGSGKSVRKGGACGSCESGKAPNVHSKRHNRGNGGRAERKRQRHGRGHDCWGQRSGAQNPSGNR